MNFVICFVHTSCISTTMVGTWPTDAFIWERSTQSRRTTFTRPLWPFPSLEVYWPSLSSVWSRGLTGDDIWTGVKSRRQERSLKNKWTNIWLFLWLACTSDKFFLAFFLMVKQNNSIQWYRRLRTYWNISPCFADPSLNPTWTSKVLTLCFQNVSTRVEESRASDWNVSLVLLATNL